MRPISRLTSMTGLVVGLAFVASACSAAVATPSANTAPAGAAGVTLASTNDPTLGAYLTGLNGMTLYLYTKDTPDTTVCYGTCATNWPPLTVASGATITGPSGATAAFATISRTDGTTQVTYNHWPLYYYAGDSKAGDVKGQNVGTVWFVMPLNGQFSASAASSAASTAPSAAAALTLTSTNDPTLGAYLTGLNGMTLYIYTKDTPDVSVCTGTCATTWPPLTVAAGATITGPSGATAAFATITRADGTTQVTYNHWPLYYYAKDTKAGDTTGQDVGKVWFVMPLNGQFTAPAPAASPSATSGY